ncbi:hypothetical protein BDR22DRAFT_886786 [Usnea florida]
MPSGRPRPLPNLLPSLAHCPDPPYPQSPAPPVQPSYSAPSYPQGHPQQYPAPLESRISSPYTAIQVSNPYPLQISYISGIEDPRSGHVLHSHNGDGFSLTSGPQTAQLSSIEPYNSGAEQSNEQGPHVLNGMGSWASRQVPGRVDCPNNHHASDGIRIPFNCRSVTKKREGFTVDPSQVLNSVPIANNTAHPNQGTYLQGIEYQTDQSTLGIDQDLVGPYFLREYGPFAEDANNTNPSALPRRNAPSSRNVPSSTESSLTPAIDHGTHSQLAPGSSNRCHECNMDFANKQNLSRHMHEHHEEGFRYNCLLGEDGLVCTGHV